MQLYHAEPLTNNNSTATDDTPIYKNVCFGAVGGGFALHSYAKAPQAPVCVGCATQSTRHLAKTLLPPTEDARRRQQNRLLPISSVMTNVQHTCHLVGVQ